MSELQKALDRIAKMDLPWPEKQVAASKEIESEIARLTKQRDDLREALHNSTVLLHALGTPDDPVVQTAIAENEKALNGWHPNKANLNKTDGE